MTNEPDPVVVQRAHLDQFECEAPNLARLYRIAFNAMIAQGFDPQQSLALTMFAFQNPHPQA